jgi:hypothetical protein
MKAFLKTLAAHLFGPDGPETRGQRVFFRVFEGLVVAATIYLA